MSGQPASGDIRARAVSILSYILLASASIACATSLGLLPAALDDGWWLVRVAVAVVTAGIGQWLLWAAGRADRRSRYQTGETYFYREVAPSRVVAAIESSTHPLTPGQARVVSRVLHDAKHDTELEGTAAIDVALSRVGDDGVKLRVTVRARAPGIVHRLQVDSGGVAVTPGRAEDVLGPELTPRLGNLRARFDSVHGRAEAEAVILAVAPIDARRERAHTDVASLWRLVRDVAIALVENRALAEQHAGYRGRSVQASDDDLALSSVFEPLDSGPETAQVVRTLDELDPSIAARKPFAFIGTLVFAAATLMYLGAIRVGAMDAPQYIGFLGRIYRQDLPFSIVSVTILACAGILAQGVGAGLPLQTAAATADRARGKGFTRVQKLVAVLVGLAISCGVGLWIVTG